ncbi:MAG: S41 family peptidase [Chloroflexi bacterium]|nr:S41 family peptidase [Chloroflexota bacterium]
MDTNQFKLDETIHVEIIQNLIEKVQTKYIFPDIAAEICVGVQKHMADGDYTDIAEGEFLAYALSTHLQEVNQDEHLWVRFSSDPLPDEEETLRLNQAWMAEQKQEAELDNFGFHKVERLTGNVGYIDIRYFHRPEWGGDTAVSVMNSITNTNALIIDLRQCPGGYPDMISLISSYLFAEKPILLGSIYWRDDDTTQQYWTLPYVPGQRFIDKPVYVLISTDTFSGGEAFANNLQIQKRATIIGEKTDGGAHPGTSYRIHPHFEAFVPIGSAINPITNDNWENDGVSPDIPASPEEALKVAHKMALEAIIESIGNPSSRPFSKLLEEANAVLSDL